MAQEHDSKVDYKVQAIIAGSVTCLLWFGSALLAGFMVGDGGNTPNMNYLLIFGILAPAVVLPFVVYAITRRYGWIGIGVVFVLPIVAFKLTLWWGETAREQWRAHEKATVPKLIEKHMPGVLPPGLRQGLVGYFPDDGTAYLEGAYQKPVAEIAGHVRARLPRDWVEVRVKYYSDDIEPGYKKELLAKELAVVNFVSPVKAGKQNTITIAKAEDGKTAIHVSLGHSQVMRGDLLWAKKLDGSPVPKEMITQYRPQG